MNDVWCPNCGFKDTKVVPLRGVLCDLNYRECQECGILFDRKIATKYYEKKPDEFEGLRGSR